VPELFTIGHSSHSIDYVIGLLRAHSVSLVADVRSAPYSRYAPQFSKDALEKSLRDSAIDYVFLGNELGARRSEEGCYVDGQARYDRIAALPAFRRGLDAIRQETRARPVALMCSEADPIACHRTVLVARQLRRAAPDLDIVHILPDGTTESQEQAGERLVALHKLEPELFGELASHAGRVEHAFDLQAAKIAYTASATEA
jgi:uncharacterized protein (DUF488 family)